MFVPSSPSPITGSRRTWLESLDAPYQEFNFDVAHGGRVLLAQPFAGSYELIIVRNWLAGLSKRGET